MRWNALPDLTEISRVGSGRLVRLSAQGLSVHVSLGCAAPAP